MTISGSLSLAVRQLSDQEKSWVDTLLQRRHGIKSHIYTETMPKSARDIYVDSTIADRRANSYYNYAVQDANILREDYEAERRSIDQEAADFERLLPSTTLDEWTQKDSWTLDEGLALWSGIAPDSTLIVWAERNHGLHSRADHFNARQALIISALRIGSLSDPCKPADFLEWASLKHPLTGNWAGNYRVNGSIESEHLNAVKRVRFLEKRIANLQENTVSKERYLTILQLFGAICIDFYDHDPQKKRNRSTNLITETANKYIKRPYDNKTILRYVQEAMKELSPEHRRRIPDEET